MTQVPRKDMKNIRWPEPKTPVYGPPPAWMGYVVFAAAILATAIAVNKLIELVKDIL